MWIEKKYILQWQKQKLAETPKRTTPTKVLRPLSILSLCRNRAPPGYSHMIAQRCPTLPQKGICLCVCVCGCVCVCVYATTHHPIFTCGQRVHGFSWVKTDRQRVTMTPAMLHGADTHQTHADHSSPSSSSPRW